MNAPPTVGNLRAPAAFNVRTARLRGYIPELFAPTLCEASASIITSLDLDILEGPKLWEGTAEETEFQEEMGVPLFVAPWGVLWYPMASETSLASLTHLLLCRPSDAAGPPDMSEDEDLEVRTDDNHEVEELKQWASVTKSVRSNLAELVLEQRPFQLDYLLDMDMDMGISPHDVVDHGPWSDADVSFFRHVMKVIFDDVNQWPKLVRLIFRGINFHGSEDEMGETLQAFVSRMLSGVQMSEVGGDYTFFNTRNGAIKNRHGADGLKAHLEFGISTMQTSSCSSEMCQKKEHIDSRTRD